MTELYPDQCYNAVYYKGLALYLHVFAQYLINQWFIHIYFCVAWEAWSPHRDHFSVGIRVVTLLVFDR